MGEIEGKRGDSESGREKGRGEREREREREKKKRWEGGRERDVKR